MLGRVHSLCALTRIGASLEVQTIIVRQCILFSTCSEGTDDPQPSPVGEMSHCPVSNHIPALLLFTLNGQLTHLQCCDMLCLYFSFELHTVHIPWNKDESLPVLPSVPLGLFHPQTQEKKENFKI